MPHKASPSSSHRLGRKALFNCLRAQHKLEGSDCEPWQVDDYRKWPLEKLLQWLRAFGWPLDHSQFVAYGESVEGPQELLDLLIADQPISAKQDDQLFLVIFELWRRLIPHGCNIELLCDEFDYQIEAYQQGDPVDRELEKAFSTLLEIVHDPSQNISQSRSIFALIADGSAQDLELCLYEFILDQLEAGAIDYAKELHAQFEKLVRDPLWFDLACIHWSDNEQALKLLRNLHQSLKREPQMALLFEILHYLSEREVAQEFQRFFDLAQAQILDQDEKIELQELSTIYLQSREQELPQKKGRIQLLEVLSIRNEISPT